MPKTTQDSFLAFKRRVMLRQIEIVASLIKTESISQTAKDPKISAAAVSRACQRFESHLPFEIFDKKRKGMSFTKRGAALLKDIQALVKSIKTCDRTIVPHFDPDG
ncbi:MAG: LysR family transcriptional regulator [Erythrobacter sp.]|jgi:DNA-binding transcriptional LysR family regulator|nr:LysR family transcriptional regulator [Erythrobacter sp.]